jgi:predicted nucleotidyltransferase
MPPLHRLKTCATNKFKAPTSLLDRGGVFCEDFLTSSQLPDYFRYMVPKTRLQKTKGNNRESLSDILAKLRQNLPEITRRYQVKSLLHFGSYGQGRQRKRSALDILGEFRQAPSFFEFLAFDLKVGRALPAKYGGGAHPTKTLREINPF